MEIKKIQDADVEGKKILLRVDFNVAVEDATVKEKFKIQAAEETVRYLLGMNAKVALLSWLGRPGGKKDPKFSLSPIKDDVEYILGYKVKFVSDCIGEEVKKSVDDLGEGEIALLENVRFYAEEGDVETGAEYEDEFAKKMADGFDIFVNDAISVSHRNQASVVGVTKFLPSYAGFRLQKEIEEMKKVKNNPERPAVAIIGGAKIETKLPVIKFFEGVYDNVLVGGKIANEALGQEMKFSEKVLLPIDFVDDCFDIGPKTVAKFKNIIASAKTIVWNGPMGKFEEEKYAAGTDEIFRAIMESGAYVLIGGGETLEILEKNKAMNKVGFVSTGGGAMLEYLGGGKMPGIEALKR
ncbi:MAG TPA: phosphoglycerate kinase [Candidatus Moranbacteria bacterium]|nr:phosphoglycerate kinase [Candidatus Moranbacteria bacterium]